MNLEGYQKNIRRLAEEVKDDGGPRNQYEALIKELLDYLNDNRGRDPQGKKYPPLEAGRVKRLVSYIYKAGDLPFFVDEVQKKGSWYFWWTVKPKKK